MRSSTAPVFMFQSKNIFDYKPILEGLIEDFGFAYYHAILTWCNIIDNTDNNFWQVYLIRCEDEIVGMCGLYSLYENSIDELWLGWFGIIPSKRNKKIGESVLGWMKYSAKKLGCKKLMSYVDEEGKPLPFYYRNGFHKIGIVKEYLSNHPELSIKDFENENDHIIEFDLRFLYDFVRPNKEGEELCPICLCPYFENTSTIIRRCINCGNEYI